MVRGIPLAICLLTGLASVMSADKWSYVGKTGPHHWNEIFPEACGGKKQSPIDLKAEETLYNPDLKDFAIWYDPPRPDSKMYIKNTGYTLHVVSYNHDMYSDIGQAVQQPGGLAVLGVLFELSEEDNPSFDYIIRGMKHIRNPNKLAKIELPLFSLRDLLPNDISRYYRYNGSLTTPGCFETVTWSVFDQPQTISHKQMEEFRKLLQFKRKHHKHHHHKNEHQAGDSPSRKRRDMSAAEKEKEHNAKQVLDELGINGKDSQFEREIFKRELVTANSNNNMAKPDTVNVVEGGDVQTDPTEATYVQDYIGNNFRPVQPLNDRIVYRSFKLREVVTRYNDNVAAAVQTEAGVKYYSDNNNHHHGNSHEKSPGDGASVLNVSLMTVLMTSLSTFLIRLLH